MQKKYKEQVIKRWREMGFLAGVNEKSPLEWRMANSFELVSVTLMEFLADEEFMKTVGDKLVAAQVFVFPIIKDCLTTKNRITHTILPEQALWPLFNLTCKELFTEVSEKNPKFKKRIYAHDKMREFLLINEEYDATVIDILMKYQTESGEPDDKKNKLSLDIFRRLTNVDLVAWILDMVSDYIKLKSDEFDEGLLPWEEEVPYRIEEPETTQEEREALSKEFAEIIEELEAQGVHVRPENSK